MPEKLLAICLGFFCVLAEVCAKNDPKEIGRVEQEITKELRAYPEGHMFPAAFADLLMIHHHLLLVGLRRNIASLPLKITRLFDQDHKHNLSRFKLKPPLEHIPCRVICDRIRDKRKGIGEESRPGASTISEKIRAWTWHSLKEYGVVKPYDPEHMYEESKQLNIAKREKSGPKEIFGKKPLVHKRAMCYLFARFGTCGTAYYLFEFEKKIHFYGR